MNNGTVENRELLEPLRPMRRPVKVDDVLSKIIMVDKKTSKNNDKIEAMERRIEKNEEDINMLKVKNRCIIS